LEKVLKFWFYKMHRGAVRMVLGHAAGATTLGSALYFASLGPSIMSETPLQASNHLYSAQTKKYPREKRRNTVSDGSLENLKERGYVVIDNVLSKEELKSARLEIKKVHFDTNDNDNKSVRNDKVAWISENTGSKWHLNHVGDGLLKAIRVLRSIPLELIGRESSPSSFLDEKAFRVPFSNQLALYDGKGEHYIAHRDVPVRGTDVQHPLRFLVHPGLDERQITIILYLNDTEWDSKAGGMKKSGNLCVYLNTDHTDKSGSTASEKVYIEPKGGRMVIFDSTILHEVLPSHQPRYAITCWAGGRPCTEKQAKLRPFFLPMEEFQIPSFL
jgi:hypothetical protein